MTTMPMVELSKEELIEILEQLGKLPCSDVWQLVQHLATKLAESEVSEPLIKVE